MKQIKIFSNCTKRLADEDINNWILREGPFDKIKVKPCSVGDELYIIIIYEK